jgi:nucleoside-diphosphate-sugar epimerase
MNILITGAGGFIGAHIFRNLSKNHNTFRILSKPAEKFIKNDIILNLESSKSVSQFLKSFPSQVKIDVIINLASKLSSSDNINDSKTLIDNIHIAENIAKIAAAVLPKKLINFSSSSVYPNITGTFSEESLPSPQKNTDCFYGLSKQCSETIIDFLLSGINTEVTHLRLSQVYGDGMNSERIMPVMLKELKNHNTITVFGSGERKSNFIEINTLTKIVNDLITIKISGVFNLGDINMSYFHLAEDLIRQHGNENSKIVKVIKGNKSQFILNTQKLDDLIELHKNDV